MLYVGKASASPAGSAATWRRTPSTAAPQGPAGRGARPRRDPHRYRGRGAAARSHAGPPAPAALQRAAQGRQDASRTSRSACRRSSRGCRSRATCATTARATSGPFTDVKRLRRTLRDLRRMFPIRTCLNFEDYQRADRPVPVLPHPALRRSVHHPVARLAQRVPGTGRRPGAVPHRQGPGAAAPARGRDGRGRGRAPLRDTRRAVATRSGCSRRLSAPQRVVARARRARMCSGSRATAGARRWSMLRVRGGRVMGKESRRARTRGRRVRRPSCIAAFLSQHYLALEELSAPDRDRPRCPTTRRSSEALAAASRSSGRRSSPERGRERRLVASGRRNAALALEDRRSARPGGARARFLPEVLELQRALDLAEPPYRIVCFDISNLGAEGAVAAVVASENGRPAEVALPPHAHAPARPRRLRDDPRGGRALLDARGIRRAAAPRPGGRSTAASARSRAARAARSTAPPTRPVSLIGLAKREETIMREGAPRCGCRAAALRSARCSACATRRTASASTITARLRRRAAESAARSTRSRAWVPAAAPSCSRPSARSPESASASPQELWPTPQECRWPLAERIVNTLPPEEQSGPTQEGAA